jgi:hypothetical protein
MKALTITLNRKEALKTALIDLSALALVYFTPTLVHLLNFPVYMLEPMRVMLIISFAYSAKRNSYLLALSLPLFSFLVSGHPEFLKMMVITAELTLNVYLFYFLLERRSGTFLAALLSIAGSKLFCYLLYLVVFSWAFVRAEAAPVFLLVQLLTTFIFSGYLFLLFKRV